MRTIRRLIQQDTREGFRLLAAWVLGLITFGLLSELSRQVILYFQPWKSESIADSDAVLFLLLVVLGLGFLAVVAALGFEGLDRYRRTCRRSSAYVGLSRDSGGGVGGWPWSPLGFDPRLAPTIATTA
jgi:hypothetical protein